MMERRDREARFEKFRSIDPDNRDQAMGYGDLIDESGLTLKRIPLGRGYVDLPEKRRSDFGRTVPSRGRSFFGWRKPAKLAKWIKPEPAFNAPEFLGFDFIAIFADWRQRSS
jgi:hypothetical protein